MTYEHVFIYIVLVNVFGFAESHNISMCRYHKYGQIYESINKTVLFLFQWY